MLKVAPVIQIKDNPTCSADDATLQQQLLCRAACSGRLHCGTNVRMCELWLMRFGAGAQSISLIRIQLEIRYTTAAAAAAATAQIPSGADAIIKYG